VIRIVVVDDHAVVRSGLRLLLGAEKDMEVVGDAGNVRDAVFEVRAAKPDVVLLDVTMPGESGIEGLPKLLHESPEREVLRLLALGHTNQEIAKQLYISVRTAETHRAHIMRKLQLSTRAELVRYAIEHGQLEPE